MSSLSLATYNTKEMKKKIDHQASLCRAFLARFAANANQFLDSYSFPFFCLNGHQIGPSKGKF
jgi:hypothetical protein